jgi:hypothetical protein
MRFDPLAQTDSLFHFIAPSWMTVPLPIGLNQAFSQSLWSRYAKLSMHPKT